MRDNENERKHTEERIEEETKQSSNHSIQASLGMFDLQVQSGSSLQETAEVFEMIWSKRVAEIEEAEADTLRQELEDENNIHIIG